jgi:hypoxanthine phosphoribosyltransferase
LLPTRLIGVLILGLVLLTTRPVPVAAQPELQMWLNPEMGKQIARDHPEGTPLLVGVLNGCIFFVADLMRAIPIPHEIDFVSVTSYGRSSESSRSPRLVKDLERAIEGRDVILIEDIVDSGLTLSWLLRNLATRRPRSLRVCTLMRKPDAVRADVDIAYVGFDIPNEFVVGYGLDYAERYRNLPFIGVVESR